MSLLSDLSSRWQQKSRQQNKLPSKDEAHLPRSSKRALPSLRENPTAMRAKEVMNLPLLGRHSVGVHQKILTTMLGLTLVSLVLLVMYTGWQDGNRTHQLAEVGDAMMQAQRLAKAVSPAISGDEKSFVEIKESAEVLQKITERLKSGGAEAGVIALEFAPQVETDKIMPLVARAHAAAEVILRHEKQLEATGEALQAINRQSKELLEVSEAIFASKLKQGSRPDVLFAAAQLGVLTERIGRSSNQVLAGNDATSQEAVFTLGKDLNALKEIGQDLMAESEEGEVRRQVQLLQKIFENTRWEAGAILGNLQGVVAAREAQRSILVESEQLREYLGQVKDQLTKRSGVNLTLLFLMVLLGILSLLIAAGLAYVQILHSRYRQRAAERQQQETTKINAENKAAIQLLMQELQVVAEGDLTRQTTVTGSITGEVADTINYTVEELRYLVSHVQDAAKRVADTTADVEDVSAELLSATGIQEQEIDAAHRDALKIVGQLKKIAGQLCQMTELLQETSLRPPKILGQTNRTTMVEVPSATDNLMETVSINQLLEKIQQTVLNETNHAQEMADVLHRIYLTTEQTTQGTRETVRQISELTRISEELRQSVLRFKIT